MLRLNLYELLKLIAEDKTESRRLTGHRKHSWMKQNIRDWTRHDLSTLIRTSQDQEELAKIVANRLFHFHVWR